MHSVIAVFGSSSVSVGDAPYRDARALGSSLADSGFAVATGGYGGTMEAVSRGAAESGGHVVGVTAPDVFPMRRGPNAFVIEERPMATLTERIHELVSTTEAAVALPGSLGTLTELLVYWNEAQVARMRNGTSRPIITVGEPWATLVPDIARTITADGDLIVHCETVDAVVPTLVDCMRAVGS